MISTDLIVCVTVILPIATLGGLTCVLVQVLCRGPYTNAEYYGSIRNLLVATQNHARKPCATHFVTALVSRFSG